MKTLLLIQSLVTTLVISTSSAATPEKITAPDGAALDRFGSAVAANAQFTVVGAPRDDDHGSASGGVYVFDSATQTFLAKITPTDGAAGDEFGAALAISGDLLLVGARFDDDLGTNSGSAYLYSLPDGILLQKITASDGVTGDQFGKAVALSGSRLAITAWLADPLGDASGATYLYDQTGTEFAKILANDGEEFDQFGAAVALDSTHLIVGAPFEDQAGADSGAAYIYDAATGTILQKFQGNAAGDIFGTSVSLHAGRALIGAPLSDLAGTNTGSVSLFDIVEGELIFTLQSPTPTAEDRFGSSVSHSQSLIAIGAEFSDSTANETGSALLFHATTGDHLRTLTAPDAAASDFFGGSIILLEDTLIATAVQDDDNGSSSGSVYLTPLQYGVENLALQIQSGQIHLTWDTLSSGDDTTTYDLLTSPDLQTWTLAETGLTDPSITVPLDPESPKLFFKVTTSL